jgi:chromosome segregation ATPase
MADEKNITVTVDSADVPNIPPLKELYSEPDYHFSDREVYNDTKWNNQSPPAITAERLNHIEYGISVLNDYLTESDSNQGVAADYKAIVESIRSLVGNLINVMTALRAYSGNIEANLTTAINDEQTARKNAINDEKTNRENEDKKIKQYIGTIGDDCETVVGHIGDEISKLKDELNISIKNLGDTTKRDLDNLEKSLESTNKSIKDETSEREKSDSALESSIDSLRDNFNEFKDTLTLMEIHDVGTDKTVLISGGSPSNAVTIEKT